MAKKTSLHNTCPDIKVQCFKTNRKSTAATWYLGVVALQGDLSMGRQEYEGEFLRQHDKGLKGVITKAASTCANNVSPGSHPIPSIMSFCFRLICDKLERQGLL